MSSNNSTIKEKSLKGGLSNIVCIPDGGFPPFYELSATVNRAQQSTATRREFGLIVNRPYLDIKNILQDKKNIVPFMPMF